MGGLGGFPWTADTVFESMIPQIRVIGNALLVFGPRFEVDDQGQLRPGVDTDVVLAAYTKILSDETPNITQPMSNSIDAVSSSSSSSSTPATSTTVLPQHAQYTQLCNALRPYRDRLVQAQEQEPMEELAYVCYDIQKDIITHMVQRGGTSSNNSTASTTDTVQVAVLGGIQIGTPQKRCKDYFIPLSLELYDGQGNKTNDLWL
jgi:hypothetical protein